ncbi:MAG: hypothetical protein Kow0031_26600 [Anaerolineae bacterium]
MFNTSISARLTEMTFKPVAETAHWLRRLGLEAEERPDGVVRVRNPHLNITTAILDSSDPVARAVSLALAFFGPYWPQVTPRLMKDVDQVWKARVKEHKAQQKGEA